MSEQEIQQLLHESPLTEVKERPGGKTALYSVGFIFGFKLRQKLRTVDELEMEVYISHLRSVLAARECDRGSLAENIAQLCEMYVLKELKMASHRLVKLRQKRFEGYFTYPVGRCFGKTLYRRVPARVDYDDITILNHSLPPKTP
jgi:hypothetical protein